MKKRLPLGLLLIIMTLFILAVSAGCGAKKQETPQPFDQAPPQTVQTPQTQTRIVTLYFSDDQAQFLLPEAREITFQGGAVAKAIIEELAKGPKEQGHYTAIPQTTRVLSVNISQGTAYLDLSRDFEKDYPGGSAGERMALGSIVNSLTELKEIFAVQFLIEGKKVEALAKGHADLSRPLARAITYGSVEQDAKRMENEQLLTDQGQRKWRLDPLSAAKTEGPLHGLYAGGEYSLVSKKEKGEYSGVGEAVVKTSYKGFAQEIYLIQPVKNGPQGIWAINSIMPLAAEQGAIAAFLENRYMFPNFGGKVFSAYQVLGEKKNGNYKTLYIWALCQEYYKEGGTLKKGSGVSLPLALILFAQDAGHNGVVDYKAPEDGAGYGPSIKKIFPASLQDKVLAGGNVQELSAQVQAKAEAYYK